MPDGGWPRNRARGRWRRWVHGAQRRDRSHTGSYINLRRACVVSEEPDGRCNHARALHSSPILFLASRAFQNLLEMPRPARTPRFHNDDWLKGLHQTLLVLLNLIVRLHIAAFSNGKLGGRWLGCNPAPAPVQGEPNLTKTQWFQSDWELSTQLMEDAYRASNIGQRRWPLSLVQIREPHSFYSHRPELDILGLE